MAIEETAYRSLITELKAAGVELVAVSKTRPPEEIFAVHQLGQRDFGENYVQELVAKQTLCPADIRWHYIGHLQRNKVRSIVPFVHLIHGVDSIRLLREINKEADRAGKLLGVLLQVHIAREETKFGLNEQELDEILNHPHLPIWKNVSICGLMGMASFTEDESKIRAEFRYLKGLYDKYRTQNNPRIKFQTLSMGMSNDYKIAIEEGSTLVRIGSLIFGPRPQMHSS